MRRLTVDLSDTQFARMDRLIPWGQKGNVISTLLDEVLDMIEQHGNLAIGAILNRDIKVLDIIATRQEKRKDT